MAFLNNQDIEKIGFASIGENVKISDRASFYRADRISIGHNVRIDDFCVLSAGDGGISIGNYIHIAVFTSLIGASEIKLSDFSNLSSRVSIYSSNDDYSGAALMGPMIPVEYTNVNSAPVFIGRHAIIGSGSIVLPGALIGDGVSIGALSLVNKNCEAFGVYVGIPARRVKERLRDFLKVEEEFIFKNTNMKKF